MPTLLAKLNKRPRKRVAADTTSSRVVRVENGVVIEVSHKEQNYKEIENKQSGVTSEIIKRLSEDNEEVPWWIQTPPKNSHKLDTIVPIARSILNQQIAKQPFDEEELRRLIRRALNSAEQKLPSEIPLTNRENEEAGKELYNFFAGKGVLQALFDDVSVTDIFVDSFDSIRCMRRGQNLDTPFKFRDHSEYEIFVATLLNSSGQVLDQTHPIISAVLPDKWRTRIHALHPSILDRDEPSLAIRIPRLQQVTFYELLRSKTLPATAAAWLSELVTSFKANILVTGPAGSGKTTMVNALLTAIPSDERIISIEEVPELFLASNQMEKLVVRPASSSHARIGFNELFDCALRRCPRRIAFGDILDRDIPTLKNALVSGHPIIASISVNPGIENIDIELKMSIRDGRPCLDEISDLKGDVVILAFDSELDGKRKWRIQCQHSPWLQRMKDRGHQIVTGANVLPCIEN